jgi:uncharacterized membrane protein (DUF4010 family)
MSAQLTPLELAARLALALALALFLGLAFEEIYKREERSIPGGVRTFPLLALSGAMLYLIEPGHALAFIAGLLALAAWQYAYMCNPPAGSDRPTLMIPVSNLVAYLIGPVALIQPPWVAVAASVAAVLLVGTREKLHRLITVVPQEELLTAGTFLILVGIILPLVPNAPVTTATPLTPYHVWLAVVAISTLSYFSYLLQTYVPARNASLLPAVLGGIYSSTATTVVLAKRQREAGGVRADLAAGIVAATTVMYLRLTIIIALFDARFAWALAPAMAILFLLGAALAAYEWRRSGKDADQNLQVPAANPLQLPTALTFAVIFVVVSVLTQWIRTAFGETGVLVLAAIVGITDIDPFVINIAQGGAAGLPLGALSAAILIAASANNIAKAAYALGFGGAQNSRRPAAMLVALAIAGFAIAAVYLFWRT